MKTVGAILSGILFALFLLFISLFLIIWFLPERLPEQLTFLLSATPLPTVGSVAIVPTNTPIPSITPTLIPTWTPGITIEYQASKTPTRKIPSSTPISTFPPLTATATQTFTPSPIPSPTLSPTPAPTGPTAAPTHTRSAFIFTKTVASPMYLQNNIGCGWSAIAGEVLNLSGEPVASNLYQIHLFGNGIDRKIPVGSTPLYGPSGWEHSFGHGPTSATYNISLQTVNGTTLSQIYQFNSSDKCERNLILFNFEKNH